MMELESLPNITVNIFNLFTVSFFFVDFSNKNTILNTFTEVTVDTFSSGSKSESALLLEATEYFYKRSPKADEIIRNIKSDGKLDSAVKKCIEAAGYEFTISTQRSLLKVPFYGSNN